MKKILAALSALTFAALASAATLTPIQLLNPAGSTSGQAILSTGPSTNPTWGSPTFSFPAQAANTFVANTTNASASPTAKALPSCSTASSALLYTTNSGLSCNTAINASTLGGVAAASYAPLNSPTFTGTPTVPGYLSTSAAASTYAPLNSPTFTGSPTVPGYLSTSSASSTYAPLASPTFTGTVTIPAGASISGYIQSTGANTFTGAQTISLPGNMVPLILNETSGSANTEIQLQSAGVVRWGISHTGGHTFGINRYNSSGTLVDSPFAINPSTGAINLTSTGGLAVSGLITPASAIGIKGTATNDSAQAGSIGELANNGAPTAVGITTNTATNCGSLSLSAGQWMVYGTVTYTFSAAAPSQLIAGYNATSATLPANGLYQSLQFQSTGMTAGGTQVIASPMQVFQLSTNSTIYSIGQAGFASGTSTCVGYMRAYRMR